MFVNFVQNFHIVLVVEFEQADARQLFMKSMCKFLTKFLRESTFPVFVKYVSVPKNEISEKITVVNKII